MLRKRAVVAAAAALTTVLVLAGCGRSNGSDAGGSAATISSGKAKGTIKVWAQGAEAQFLPEIVKGFEKENPDAKVEITAIPWASAHQKYQTAIAGGSTPDLAQMGTTWMADFADAFQTVPDAVDTSGMYDSAVNAAKVDGVNAGVPWYVDTRAIYYRKDLAEKAGYSTPPTTWDGLKAMAKAMQEKAGAKFGMSLPTGAVADDFQLILPFLWSNGGELTNADGTKWTFDTSANVKAMEYINSYFTDGISNKSADTAVGANEANFANGSVPMLINAPAEISQLAQAGGGDAFKDKIGVMRFPKEKSSTSFVGGSDLAVFKKASNADGAWKLVQYLSKPDVQAQFWKLTGDLPSVDSAWDKGELKSDPLLQVFRDQLGDTKSPPANTGWTQVSSDADSQLEKMVRGGSSPAEAMKALQSAADGVGTGK
ncbi:sugar ABC transporter substrate-binding protein [Leifsonia sp. NPDC080035]|uniref:Sugar ABC transporter substrate-binding protein n=1 Tax=Leifsonia sp. NPDC080035 TaxID=3143936 RepID=A0AAU7G6B7_9MICO